jgi:hypothetical protein
MKFPCKRVFIQIDMKIEHDKYFGGKNKFERDLMDDITKSGRRH